MINDNITLIIILMMLIHFFEGRLMPSVLIFLISLIQITGMSIIESNVLYLLGYIIIIIYSVLSIYINSNNGE